VSRIIRIRYDHVSLGELYRGASRQLLPSETKSLYALTDTRDRRVPGEQMVE